MKLLILFLSVYYAGAGFVAEDKGCFALPGQTEVFGNILHLVSLVL